ncbi:MAG: 5-formyltetrahydrofolate cyclo-ligase [Synechococcales cyanobacterium T60_A2020_003]|nr:5-formyltetrahydrofolate cyclo-ligase [Synechococcales cyanobacterium T60_A2020_003]
MTAHQLEKADLRRSLIQARRSLPVATWQAQSQQICDRLVNSPLLQASQTILAYFSIRQEPDLSPLFDLPYRWGFPRCEGDRLTWHQWEPGDLLVEGAFGILEPAPEAIAISANEVDLMLIPSVACDRQGYRLGYGGGFYDRLLSQPDWRAKRTVGIVFDDAFLPTLPVDTWDHPLYAVCTDSQLCIVR